MGTNMGIVTRRGRVIHWDGKWDNEFGSWIFRRMSGRKKIIVDILGNQFGSFI